MTTDGVTGTGPPAGREASDLAAMARALVEAARAPAHGDVPVGAVVLVDGEIVAARHNERGAVGRPHGPRRTAGVGRRIGRARLVAPVRRHPGRHPRTVPPGAPVRWWQSRLGRLVFGAADPKAGACGSLYNLCADPRLNHELPVTAGVSALAGLLLTDFFTGRRDTR